MNNINTNVYGIPWNNGATYTTFSYKKKDGTRTFDLADLCLYDKYIQHFAYDSKERLCRLLLISGLEYSLSEPDTADNSNTIVRIYTLKEFDRYLESLSITCGNLLIENFIYDKKKVLEFFNE